MPHLDSGVESPLKQVWVAVLLAIGLYLAAGPVLRLSEWHIADGNSSAVEAKAWHAGRADLMVDTHDALRVRPRDTAYWNGKVYHVYPPLFTVVCYVATGLQKLQGIDATTVYRPWYVGLIALPVLLVGFWAFRAVTGRSEHAALMTAYWVLGTPMLKMLVGCRDGSVNSVNHVWCDVGLLLIAGDLLGKRRIWPGAIGLVIATWTRQLSLLYAIPLIWAAVSRIERPRSAVDDSHDARSGGAPEFESRNACKTSRRWVIAVAGIIVAVGPLMALNWLRFGNPLDSGYARLYEGRDDMYAHRARKYGRLFDPRFIPAAGWHMNISPPKVEWAKGLRFTGHPDGTSIWITSPLLLYALVDVRRWWHDRARRMLMMTSMLVILGFLSYHNTGSVQRGYFRFALDFIPIWLMVIAPYACEGQRIWWTVACLGWSALYFHVLCLWGA